ncbi:MAG TPA: chromosome segregation protein SMC [Polyangiaceae bacterium]|nr:chromosome segregation protein SMC [Polyangiaceae bacterium]
MKIKKLELSGFKSFVDRTVLHFDHDVLAIVGPNGCGKSNIVDAIRWCMGEQSARHLRGRSMEDVLFGGSETRTPHDMAEVTLTFENDGAGDLPLEYRDYAEIAVTRRLFRNGDSEYLINKTPVRLRDVTDLFLGTGAGTKAYSIVEQGKVGLIVSAKPEDRRLLIEEAAGITKFKSRRKQAERKMELTQQNLLRVGDIVAEIERNLASLKRQAAKAERYVAYRNELEDLQLYDASHRYLELAGYIRRESGDVERLTEAHERCRGDLAARDSEAEAVRLDVHAAEEALESAQNVHFAAENGVRVQEAAIERAKDRIASLGRREQQAGGEKNEMADQSARLAAERDVVAAEVRGLAEQEAGQAEQVAREEAKLADFAGAHELADRRVTERRSTIATAAAEIASAEAKLAGFDRRQGEMVARRDKLNLERDALERARVEHASRVAELTHRINDLRSGHVTTAAERSRLEGRLAELKGVIIAQDKALEESKGDLSRKRSRLAALEEMHARLEGVGSGTKSIMQAHDPCVVGLVADRVEAPANLTQALAGLLGSRLQDVVVRDVGRGVSMLAELARDRKGRAAIVPLHAPFVAGSGSAVLAGDGSPTLRLVEALRFAPEDEALVRSLVGDALVAEDLAGAVRLRDEGVRAPIVTFDGAVVHPDGRIEGGQGDALAAGMLDGKREARELAKEVERLEAVVTHRLGLLAASRAEIAQTGEALDRARHAAHAREIALVAAEKDQQKAQHDVDGALRRAQALDEEHGELDVALAEAAYERDEAARGLHEARARIEAAQGDLGDAEAALAEAAERLEGQRQVLTACKVGIAGTRERIAAARGAEGRLSRSADELWERGRRLDEELLENARALGETAAGLMAHKGELHDALDRARAAQAALVAARGTFEELRARLAEHEDALRGLRSRVDEVREELQGHELLLREKQLALEHLLAGVAERFRGLHLPRIVGDYHLRPAPDEVTRARIEELARLIERMGGVNLDAMREHAEAEERFAFYTTQKADLEKALSDLTRAIQQMNRESRRLFEDTFVAVNERFKEIFPRMFRGGRAELRMTDPADLLETGIDIVAQPPGKKLSSIELMSGGEKALTAVSLIFAIFQIKPSPFCILDEVDAPLDEANVARYNDMVRSMTDRSQFILITHVKRTMQTADVLYGVTMPEAGVSKIVSVKISDVSERRAVGASRGESPGVASAADPRVASVA